MWSRNLCGWCYEKFLTDLRLVKAQKNFAAASNYNQYLFENFIRYVRRYALRCKSAQQAEQLATLLSTAPVPAITSWNDIYSLKKEHPFKISYKGIVREGHPFHKIGYMLEELGAIAPRPEMLERRIERILQKLDHEDARNARRFVECIRQKKSKEDTFVRNLQVIAAFAAWAKARNKTIATVEKPDYAAYVAELRTKYKCPIRATTSHYRLARYYRWCLSEKILTANPTTGLKMPPNPKKHTVCSDSDIKKLSRFVRSKSSDPEQAFLLALILVWGMTYNELSNAQLDFDSDCLTLILRSKKPSYQKRVVRPQILKLPDHPKWFKDLAERYLTHWKFHFKLAKRDTARQSLFIPHHHLFNRPVSTNWLRIRVLKGTIAATGRRIPADVLRKTCATIYVKHNDASMLREFGWASDSAFTYVWTPKVIF